MVSIRAPKDFWAGVMFIAFAAVALYVSRNYSLGTTIRMGPGYFPMLLGGVLAVIGAILVVRSLVIAGDPIGHVQVLPLVVVAVAVVLFGVLLPRLGLADHAAAGDRGIGAGQRAVAAMGSAVAGARC